MRSNHTTTTSGRRISSFANSSSSSSSVDKPLILALATLVAIYSTLTLITYYKVSDTNYDEAATLGTALSGGVSQQQQATLHTQKQQQRQIATAPKQSKISILQHLFPIHVGQDTEVIVHPGLALVADLHNSIPSTLPRNLTVPKFFDESHGSYYFDGMTDAADDADAENKNHTVRHYLGDGIHLMTPERAATIGSYTEINNNNGVVSMMETIYCSVASYRDPECTGTVEDLFARAEYPERIRVAILDQRVNGDPICSEPEQPCETNPEQALCQYRHLIDVYEMDAVLAVGPVFARHLAHRHYRGEYYAMQIDSHVRFTEHWDSDIIGQWKSASNEMAVLSTYLSDIIGSIDPVTHAGIHAGRPIMCQSDYEGNGNYKHLRHGQQPEGEAGIKNQPTLHPFWAAGFSFARGHFVIQVPYDQYLPMVFQGEEISIGLRGFTYGYDYYAAERSVCFHMYAIKENTERRKKVPLFWEHSNLYRGVGESAMKRLNSIIQMGNFPESEWSHEEIHKYGLGQVRNVTKFFKTFGIHVEQQTVEQHLCSFVGKPMMRVFLPAMRPDHMGLDYDKIQYEFVDPTPNKKAAVVAAAAQVKK